MAEHVHVVIAGGGFGGIYAGLQCERITPDPDRMGLTLISRDNFFVFTPQHAIRQGKLVSNNIGVSIMGGQKRAFAYDMKGQLASLGERSGVANFYGIKFSGFFAWWLWRTVYLFKLPQLDRKVRVALDWTLDLIFARDIVKLKTFSPEFHGRAIVARFTRAGAIGPQLRHGARCCLS